MFPLTCDSSSFPGISHSELKRAREIGNGRCTAGLHYLELTELAARIKAREISPVEVTRAQLDRIAALDGELGSYVR